MQEKEVRYDLDGNDILTDALTELLNRFPRLTDGDKIEFSTLDAEYGKAIYPISGAIIETESTDITGEVTQVCRYPFFVIYRISSSSEQHKVNAKEWLDDLGRWLERQPILVDGAQTTLSSYPPLSGRRRFLSIERQTPAYLNNTNDNKTEDWAVYITARYSNEFTR